MSTAKIKAVPRLVAADEFDWTTRRIETRTVTKDEAERFLSHRNNYNRPYVERRAIELAEDLTDGRFVFNGDTVRFNWNGDLMDGQHRLWAIVLSGLPAELILVFGLDPEVFDTIDIGARRSAADTVATLGAAHHRQVYSSACQWLTRLQRGDFQSTARALKVSNRDVKIAVRENPDLYRSVEICTAARSIINPGILTAVHYLVAVRKPELAERLIDTLLEPGGCGVTDPFYVFRDKALEEKNRGRRRHPTMLLALLIKAINAAAANKRVKNLAWRSQGRGAEQFPKLAI